MLDRRQFSKGLILASGAALFGGPGFATAALASENKQRAHPASVDTIPTSANQEDHVSMAAHAGYRLLGMAENAAGIVAVEWLCAAQGIDLRAPLVTSDRLLAAQALLRAQVPFMAQDRYLAPDLAAAKALVQSGDLRRQLPGPLLSGPLFG